ncbi:MAG: response regulator [Desulfobacterales bacterium]|nr:response regulator [Desulfobacterales bacterium]
MEASKSQAHEPAGTGFAGTLRNIQLTDIIQMCCLAGASICVRVRQDQQQGTLFIQDGDIVHAECGMLTGVNAFFTILGWPSGQFETLDGAPIAKPTIKEPYQFLLMEAARRADEQAQSRMEAPAVVPEVVPAKRLRVLIVDDSAIMSKILTSMLMADPSIEVVGNAKNGEDALEKMKQLTPDLITMDVNMPIMDGSTALKHIMIESPCPVVIMSNLSPSSYATILSFLNLGAVDFMSKPVKNRNIIKQQQRMVERVHLAVSANIKRFQRLRLPKLTAADFVKVNPKLPCERMVIAVSGVGGFLEVMQMVSSLPINPVASVLSMQSIPPQFAPALSEYLNARSRFEVQALDSGAVLCPGRCYIGASGRSLEIGRVGTVRVLKDATREDADEVINSLDQLLGNAAELFGNKIVVFLLSGGEVGTMAGLHKIKAAGGYIVAPQPDKCIMPKSIAPVVDEGLITELFDPKDMVHVLRRYCS